MESWIEIADRLQGRFVRATQSTLDRMRTLVERLAEHPRQQQARGALAELRRAFHGLATSGACHGFPGIAAGGADGERRCDALLDTGGLLAGADVGVLRSLVEGMRAELAAPPTGPAAGTGPAGPAGARPSRAVACAPRILYMEDSPLQAAYVRAVLEAADYEVRWCAEPRDFAAELEAFVPAMVLMDVLLPGATGYELVRTLRGEERFATLPVLFLTSEDEVQARIEAMRSGGDDHLVKPVQPQLLLSTVAAHLARGRRFAELLDRDGLTRLLTPTALLHRARQLVDRQRRGERRHDVWVMIDLDHFKSINDGFGHPAGDRVLAAAAAHLSGNLRGHDFAGRCGGEEFALLLDGPSEREALALVERLRAGFAAQTHEGLDGVRFTATWSAGVAALRPGMSLEQWRAAADLALYAAKAAGRNRVELARPAQARLQARPPAMMAARPWPLATADLAMQAPW
jgi:diguanylate cyclase (GGDEF)-like protein